jgi:hypothetical protein
MLDRYGRILKRGSRRTAIVLIVALSSTVTLAQTELPSNADALFLDFFRAPDIGCFAFPLGKVQLLVGANGRPAPTQDFNRDMLALEKMGLLRIEATNERQARTATFNVTLSAKPDGIDLGLRSDAVYREGFCVKVYDYSPAKVEFTKVEYVKGGSAGWTGAIADAVIHDKKFTQLYKRFDELRMEMGHSKEGQPTESDSQYRILFREDPSEKKWRLVTFDLYEGGRFLRQTVPQALTKD